MPRATFNDKEAPDGIRKPTGPYNCSATLYIDTAQTLHPPIYTQRLYKHHLQQARIAEPTLIFCHGIHLRDAATLY